MLALFMTTLMTAIYAQGWFGRAVPVDTSTNSGLAAPSVTTVYNVVTVTVTETAYDGSTTASQLPLPASSAAASTSLTSSSILLTSSAPAASTPTSNTLPSIDESSPSPISALEPNTAMALWCETPNRDNCCQVIRVIAQDKANPTRHFTGTWRGYTEAECSNGTYVVMLNSGSGNWAELSRDRNVLRLGYDPAHHENKVRKAGPGAETSEEGATELTFSSAASHMNNAAYMRSRCRSECAVFGSNGKTVDPDPALSFENRWRGLNRNLFAV